MAGALDFSGLDDGFWQSFLTQQRLDSGYRELAEQWFYPLIEQLVDLRARRARPVLLGINGCQGSGKSTLGALLEVAIPQLTDLTIAVVSLDDFYLTRAERQDLADRVHPLLATRGVPGTHDMTLMSVTLEGLLANGTDGVAVPRFDKALDDRAPRRQWPQFAAPVDIVVWEGWCLGVSPQPESALETAINTLELEEDVNGVWRRYVNSALQDYQLLFDRVDMWAMLAAPDFDSVFRWRCEQEAKLADRQSDMERHTLMTPSQIRRFIQFFERLTRFALETLPDSVHFLYRLDANRHIRTAAQPLRISE